MGLSPIKFPKIIFIGNLLNASTVTNTKNFLLTLASQLSKLTILILFSVCLLLDIWLNYILMNVMVQYLFKIQVSRRMILCDSYI